MLPLVLLALLQAPVDTVSLDVGSALTRGLEVAPALASSRFQVEAATRRRAQATPWPNPLLGVAVENLGQSEDFTGISGFEGLEGQAVLTLPLPVGRERAGSIRRAEAEEVLAIAAADATRVRVRTELLLAMGAVLRDQVGLRSAGREASALDEIAEALAAQAAAGRTSDGDAARARLATGMAQTRLARREAVFALGSADLARRLGYAPGTVIVLEAPSCGSARGASRNTRARAGELAGPGAPERPPPDLRIAAARVEAARGDVDIARGVRMPDFAPQLGVRRTAGSTGLFIGLATTVPLFDQGSERVGAFIAEENRAIAELGSAEARWAAALAGAERVLASLERAGERFDASWRDALDMTVGSADARYRLGEGTLVELLDGRRARMQALDDHADWLFEWWGARLEVARLRGLLAPASVICVDDSTPDVP